MHILLYVLKVFLLILVMAGNGWCKHGVSIDGELKYPADFKRFNYASEEAEKGGRLVLHSLGSFDKMNPFTLKGEPPFGLEMFVFETLAVGSLDEQNSQYGLIAKDIEIAEDQLSVMFTLNEDARFSDGTAISVEDIAYSMETLKGPDVHPFYPYYYKDISDVEILSKSRVRFTFSQKNRELPMIASQIPVFSKRSFADEEPSNGARREPGRPIGSGPYVISDVNPGKSITYTRNKKYWAKDHPVRQGMFNYDTITVKYYKDQTVAMEAFKAGEFDFMSINIAKQWARDLDGPRFQSGELVKKLLPHSLNAGMQGFLMNTRKTIFKDPKVRKAVGLAFDFERTNSALFFGQYTRSNSFFSNSPLAATGLPAGLELEYLEPFRDSLPPGVFNEELQPPVAKGRGGLRSNLRQAKRLLAEAGWTVSDGVLKNSEGLAFSFEIILVQNTFERVMASFVSNLEKLGMKITYRTIDPTLYTERLKNFDFDMIVTTYGQSLSPGNEQRNFWHSDAADMKGSRNYAGIRSVVVDSLIDRIIYARDNNELTAACKALDRVLWHGYYLVPNWYMSGHRIAYRNKFHQPPRLPAYFSPTQWLMTWWLK